MAQFIALSFNPYTPYSESEQRRRVISLLKEGYADPNVSTDEAFRIALGFLMAQGKPQDFRIVQWLNEEPELFQAEPSTTMH